MASEILIEEPDPVELIVKSQSPEPIDKREDVETRKFLMKELKSNRTLLAITRTDLSEMSHIFRRARGTIFSPFVINCDIYGSSKIYESDELFLKKFDKNLSDFKTILPVCRDGNISNLLFNFLKDKNKDFVVSPPYATTNGLDPFSSISTGDMDDWKYLSQHKIKRLFEEETLEFINSNEFIEKKENEDILFTEDTIETIMRIYYENLYLPMKRNKTLLIVFGGKSLHIILYNILKYRREGEDLSSIFILPIDTEWSERYSEALIKSFKILF